MEEQSRGRPESQSRPGQPAPGPGSPPTGGQQSGQAGSFGYTPPQDRGPVRLVPAPQATGSQSSADPLGQMAEQLRDQGQETVTTLTDQFRQQAFSQAQSQKVRAAESLNNVAMAIRQTGHTLRQQGQDPVAQYAERGADQVERLSGYLREHDLNDFVADIERFGRRQPVAFLGIAFGLGFLASRFLKSSTPPPAMGSGTGYLAPAHGQLQSVQSFEHSIDVAVPIQIAYGQWTQFEEFPKFMEGVEQVHQLSDKTLHWRAQIAGRVEEWDAVIVEQVPDQRIAWRNTTGAHNRGRVTFQVVNPNTTRVTLWLEYRPEGVIENVGSMLGVVQRRVEGDLNRFKQFIESRGTATGVWRGEIHNENVTNE